MEPDALVTILRRARASTSQSTQIISMGSQEVAARRVAGTRRRERDLRPRTAAEASQQQHRRPHLRAGSIFGLVTALTAVVALVVSVVSLRLQTDSQDAAQQAAARAEKVAFASRVVAWWQLDYTANQPEVSVFVQNGNTLPVAVLVARLPDDERPVPGTVIFQDSPYSPGAAGGGTDLAGEVAQPPIAFLGQVPPCTTVQVVAPFAQFTNQDTPDEAQYYTYEGDLIFADPSGLVWQRNLAETLTQGDLTAEFLDKEITEAVPPSWKTQARAPVCS